MEVFQLFIVVLTSLFIRTELVVAERGLCQVPELIQRDHAHKSMMQRLLEQRSNVKFLHAQNHSPIHIWRQLQAVYGQEGMSKTQVRFWVRCFRETGLATPTKDKPRSGKPKSARTERGINHVRSVLQRDGRQTVRDIADAAPGDIHISKSSVQRILKKDLKFSKLSAKFVPRILTDEQRQL